MEKIKMFFVNLYLKVLDFFKYICFRIKEGFSGDKR